MDKNKIYKNIYPSVTTYYTPWLSRIKELKRLKVRTFSIFLTGIDFGQRKKFYNELSKIEVDEIPHVHIRHDFAEEELDYLARRYKSRVFTIHYPSLNRFSKSKYRKKLFIENNWQTYSEKNFSKIKDFGGLCIDLSHLMIWKDCKPGNLPTTVYAVEKYRVGCNHISAVKKNGHCTHVLDQLSEVDYLAELNQKYFSEYLNIELTNPIKRQLEIKEYIAKLLAKNWK